MIEHIPNINPVVISNYIFILLVLHKDKIISSINILHIVTIPHNCVGHMLLLTTSKTTCFVTYKVRSISVKT